MIKLEKAITHRFNTGMHTAVFRSRVFDKIRLRDVYGCEDALFTLEAIAARLTIAVSKKVHLHYLVHGKNISSVNSGMAYRHLLKNCLAECRLLETYVPDYISLSEREESALFKRLSLVYVWHLGNAVYRVYGEKKKAVHAIVKGIILDPLNLAYWKSLVATILGIR